MMMIILERVANVKQTKTVLLRKGFLVFTVEDSVTNEDGVIDSDEREAMRPPKRPQMQGLDTSSSMQTETIVSSIEDDVFFSDDDEEQTLIYSPDTINYLCKRVLEL